MSIANVPKLVSIADPKRVIAKPDATAGQKRPRLRVRLDPELTGVGGLVVIGLVLVAVALFAVSLWQPWWLLKLYAPQYPRGLELAISLTGLSGDVREIDMLNHYIGMAHLDGAAVLERKYAAHAVAGICLFVVGMTLFGGHKLARSIVPAGALFPIGFVVDSLYWMHRFGHQLDPRAPLHIPTFTPELFGNGSIGQFMTFARPELGFWLASAGAACLFGAVTTRELIVAARVRRRTHDAASKPGLAPESTADGEPE